MNEEKEIKLSVNLSKLKCVKCGHSWVPRMFNPKMCPACKSRTWRKKDE